MNKKIYHISKTPGKPGGKTYCGLIRDSHFKHFVVLHGITRVWHEDRICIKCNKLKNK